MWAVRGGDFQSNVFITAVMGYVNQLSFQVRKCAFTNVKDSLQPGEEDFVN